MVDINFIGQLVDSMGEAVSRLDEAVLQKNFDDANKLRTFIFDLYKKIDEVMLK